MIHKNRMFVLAFSLILLMTSIYSFTNIVNAEYFGVNTIGETNHSLDGYIKACLRTPKFNGIINNMTVYLYGWDINEEVTCAIYDSTSLLAVTEEKSGPKADGWYVFNFTTNPVIYNDQSYYLCAFADGVGGKRFNVGGSGYYYNVTAYASGYPESLPDWVGPSSYNFSIYCSYSLDTITISNPYPGNSSTGVNLQPWINVTISDVITNTFNISWYWGTSQGSENNILETDNNINAGSVNCLFPNVTSYNTEYFWRVMVDNGMWYENNTYSFTTLGQSSGGSSTDLSGVYGLAAIGIILGFFGIIHRRKQS